MKTATAAMQAHLGGANTTLAVIWKVTRADGTVLGFTNFDQNLVYNGVTYLASSGFMPTAEEYGSQLGVDNAEVTGFLDNVVIKESDIRNGVYDYALVEQRIVNWKDLSVTMGDVLLRKGIIGNVKMQNGMFVAEVRGLTQFLSTVVGSFHGPLCRAQLYSNGTNGVDDGTHYPCFVKEADYIQNGSVGTSSPVITDALHIVPAGTLLQVGSSTPTAPAPAGWFNDGELTFTSGPNNGFTYEIKSWDGVTLTIFLPLAYQPNIGDTFTIEPGCDKTPTATGCLKFQGYDSNQNKVAPTNILNFHGEWFIPGMDQILDYPVPK